MTKAPIHAVIGVWRRGAKTFYVRRSEQMTTYPGVWSLFSTKYDPSTVDIEDPDVVRGLFHGMSDQRLGLTFIRVGEFLTSGSSDQNPMETMVHLRLYEVSFDKDPILNPRYYTDCAWLTAQEYNEKSAGQPCGLCVRLWSDYAWLKGYTDRPFLPS